MFNSLQKTATITQDNETVVAVFLRSALLCPNPIVVFHFHTGSVSLFSVFQLKTKPQSVHSPKKEKKAENHYFSHFPFLLWRETLTGRGRGWMGYGEGIALWEGGEGMG